MKTNEIMKKASGMIRKTGFKLRQSSPEILIVGGIIGVIGSAVMACKATTKVSEIQDKTDKQLAAAFAMTGGQMLGAHLDEIQRRKLSKTV